MILTIDDHVAVESSGQVVPVRTERCACDDSIMAPDTPAMIASAVFVHNQSTGHVDWAHRSGAREYALRSNRSKRAWRP